MSRTVPRCMPDVIARASHDPSSCACVSAPQTITPACHLLHQESEAMMERLHSVRRQRFRVVLAGEDKRFIRQVPPLNGEVCCRTESTRQRQRRRKRVLEWASKEIRLLGSDASVMTRISGMVSVRPSLSGNH